ncbi:MAG: hypothetical protein IPK70_15345 [Flavobacteriales bacterium]|nr:hypothetical protein [Flavobacteriales bacterium]
MATATPQQNPVATKRSEELLFVFAVVISMAALVFRRPDAFSMPWFYGEEGRDFFADAFNTGWASLFNTANGYFHLYPRLIANLGAGLGVPVERMPWVNLIAALLIYFAVWRTAWKRIPGSLAARFFAVAAITLVPLGNEIWMNQTNLQWPLSLLIVLCLCGRRPRPTRVSTVVELVVLCFACFTGPYALVLAPLAAWSAWARWRERNEKGHEALAAPAMVLAAAVIVSLSLNSHGSVQRTDGVLNPLNPGFVQAAFFQLWFAVIGKGIHTASFGAQCAGLAVGIASLIALWRRASGPSAFTRMALFAAGLQFTAVLVSYRGQPEFLSPYYAGIRNFYLPTVLIAWAALSAFGMKGMRSAALAATLMLWWCAQTAFFVGPQRYRETPIPVDLTPLDRGEAVEVPIDPQGWTMRLESRP